MSSKKVLDWFLTKRGKRFTYICAHIVITGSAVANFFPNTFFLGHYRDIIRLYNKGMVVPVSEKLQHRLQEALDLLEVPWAEKILFRPFMVYGYDIFSKGNTFSKYGVIIGLPFNFEYDSVDSVDKLKIKVNQESVVWESDAGKKLLESLVISENAQLYAMAREIRLRQSAKFFFDVFLTPVTFFFTYTFSRFLNIKFNLYSKPRSVRAAMYALVTLLTGGSYIAAKDVLQILYEKKIDKELKGKSNIFAQGGKEFYEKILQRNIALRSLLGTEGQSKYAASGNENYLIRTKHIPLVHRKAFFEEKEELPS